MNPLFWGFASAACWGTSNFVARLSGRAIGALNSLLAMSVVGVLGMSIWLWLRQAPLIWDPSGLHWLVLIGLGNAGGMLCLYAGLSRGPVSIASPMVSSSPAFVVAGGLLLGIVPTTVQLIGMAGILIGVWIVARFAHSESGLRTGDRGIGLTVAYGLGAADLFRRNAVHGSRSGARLRRGAGDLGRTRTESNRSRGLHAGDTDAHSAPPLDGGRL